MVGTVLVTGVSSYLGAGVARSLASRSDVRRVIGVDAMAPVFPVGDAEFVRADVRNPLIGRILSQGEVEVVVHLGLGLPSGSGRAARAAQKEARVLGTMQLLAMCQGRPSLRHLVLCSTAAVYGSSATTPAVLTENSVTHTSSRSGQVRDALEIESYVRGFTRRHDEVGTSVLRLAPVLGVNVPTELGEYLRMPVVPVPFGFDARLQLLHEDDAIASLVVAAVSEPVGVVNVAGAGVVSLRQALALAARPRVPVLTQTGRMLGAVSRWAGMTTVTSEHIEHVRFGRCLDLERMRTELGFEPAFTTRGVVEEFARAVWGIGDDPAADVARGALDASNDSGAERPSRVVREVAS